MSIEILASKLPDVMGSYRRFSSQLHSFLSTLLSKMLYVVDRDLPVVINFR